MSVTEKIKCFHSGNPGNVTSRDFFDVQKFYISLHARDRAALLPVLYFHEVRASLSP